MVRRYVSASFPPLQTHLCFAATLLCCKSGPRTIDGLEKGSCVHAEMKVTHVLRYNRLPKGRSWDKSSC